MLIPASVLAPVFHAVRAFAPLLARGLLAEAEVLPLLLDRAAKLAPAADPGGRHTRIAHALHDAVAAFDSDCARARRAIRFALTPMLERRDSSADMLAAALAQNQAHGAPLQRWEVVADLDDMIATELRWIRRAALRQRRAARGV